MKSTPFKSKLEIPQKNTLNSYLPIRTRDNELDVATVTGLILRSLLRKKIENYEIETFKNDCKTAFSLKANSADEDFWLVLEEMYFDQQDVFSISPELFLFKAQKGLPSSADKRFADMYINLLQNVRIEEFDGNTNFIEREFISTFRKQMKDDQSIKATEEPYLPFLSTVFREDLKFLANKPKYFINEIYSFLAFYGFAYVSQLSLSITDWRTGKPPVSKPLYFIMDHERASNERVHIKNHGFKLFNESAIRLFPVLSMLENLQPDQNHEHSKKIPLWAIAKNIQDSNFENVKSELEKFAYEFRRQRKLSTELIISDSALDWLGNIIKLAEAQFKVGERLTVNKKYVTQIEKNIAAPFIQNRGRSGRVLVLNQDYIILLTNLAVGEKSKIRFRDLIFAFKLRGVFVDKQTEQELMKFYERIGNIERMSDSGDAVYVRKTI